MRSSAGLIVAVGLSSFGQAQADTASVQQTLVQLERDWAEAGVKNDAAAVGKFIADDWIGIDFEGKSVTKAEVMADMKSGASATQSEELGPVKVRVFGNTAVVTGSDTEKSIYKGKDSSGKYVWTDVWVIRGGHWQAVASQSAKAGK
jgi:ketosteroid isomerase-like protein